MLIEKRREFEIVGPRVARLQAPQLQCAARAAADRECRVTGGSPAQERVALFAGIERCHGVGDRLADLDPLDAGGSLVDRTQQFQRSRRIAGRSQQSDGRPAHGQVVFCQGSLDVLRAIRHRCKATQRSQPHRVVRIGPRSDEQRAPAGVQMFGRSGRGQPDDPARVVLVRGECFRIAVSEASSQ